MKIRILGNSIRLRLSQSEVKSLTENNIVEEKTYFGPTEESVFIYSLEKKDTNEIRAALSNNHMRIYVPGKTADDWSNSNDISLENHMSLGHGLALKILIEKDFKCLTERGEDESDLFPNPAESC